MPPLAPELSTDQIRARLEEGLGDALIETIEAHGFVTARVRAESWVDAARFLRDDEIVGCPFFSWLSAIDWTERDTGDSTLGGEEAEVADDGQDTDESEEAASAEEQSTEGAEAETAAETPEAAEPDEGEEPAPAFQPFPLDHAPGTYAQPQGELYQVAAWASAPGRGFGILIKAEIPKDSPSIASISDVYAGANWHERECHEMFGIDFEGHPHLEKLYLPEDFEGHPLQKDFRLGAREVKPWPGIVDVEEIPPDLEPILEARARGGEAESSDDEEPASDAEGAEGEAPE